MKNQMITKNRSTFIFKTSVGLSVLISAILLSTTAYASVTSGTLRGDLHEKASTLKSDLKSEVKSTVKKDGYNKLYNRCMTNCEKEAGTSGYNCPDYCADSL
jgi:hypothetical protein